MARTLDGLEDNAAEAEIGWVIDLITAIRSVKSEMNITASTFRWCSLACPKKPRRGRERWAEFIKRLARVSEISSAAAAPAGRGATGGARRGRGAAAEVGVIDLAAERARLAKEMKKAEDDIKRVDAKLGNEKFVANAPEEVVEEEKGQARRSQWRASSRSPRRSRR